ncbi:MAG: polyprenyl synthetase family protein [Candidatus Heimdallarchaeota archaeon]|nr:polyprenyl synthetase family protein [Candidatus Heimdallarchaeota archaeon]
MELKKEIAKRGQKARAHLFKMTEVIINPKVPLRDAAEHYLHAGGKGFRPAMMMMACGALGGNEDDALSAAAAIEAVHVSSLIHDDFMDQDRTRRGSEAVWVKWDPTVAILSGDVMVGLAFEIAGNLDVPIEMRYEISKGLASIYTQLCHGQMLDINFEQTEFADLSIDDITFMQNLKTGVLFEFSCVTGARIALKKLDDPMIDIIREYAHLAGTAFQIQDDIIGLLGDEEEVGKPIGSDIRQGKRTLIAVHAYVHANAEQRERLMVGLGNHEATEDEIKQALEVMKEIGSIEHAIKLAKDMSSQAMQLADKLPENGYSALLKEFASYMISRSY